MKLKKIAERVERWLERRPELRDSDEKLCANMWFEDLKNQHLDPEKLSAKNFLILYGEGKLNNGDSITRVRRIVQEKHVPLRGNNYKRRQAELQEETKRELKEI